MSNIREAIELYLEPVEDDIFYSDREAAEQSWSTRQLERNIATGWYERLLKPPKENQPVMAQDNVVSEFIKDPYVLEFLGLPEDETVHENQAVTKTIP